MVDGEAVGDPIAIASRDCIIVDTGMWWGDGWWEGGRVRVREEGEMMTEEGSRVGC